MDGDAPGKRTTVVVHRISDGASTLEEMGGGVSLLMEALVVAAACGGEANSKLRAVDCRGVGDELSNFRSTNAVILCHSSCELREDVKAYRSGRPS